MTKMYFMPEGSSRDTAPARAAHHAAAIQRAERYRWIFERERELSARKLAAKLNEGYYKEPPPSGNGRWTSSSVIRTRNALGLMQHTEWDQRYGKRAAKRAKLRAAAQKAITKAEHRGRALRGLPLIDYEAVIAWLMDHPEPMDWPDGAVRYSARERCYIMRDGSAVRPQAHTLLPAKPEVMRRRRNYSQQLRRKGVPGVYFPLSREEAEALLVPHHLATGPKP